MRSATPNFYALSREGSNLELNWIDKLLAVGQGAINNSNEAITVKKVACIGYTDRETDRETERHTISSEHSIINRFRASFGFWAN